MSDIWAWVRTYSEAFWINQLHGRFRWKRPAIDTPTHQAVNAAVGPRLDLPCLAFAIEFGFALLPVRVSHGHGHGPWHTAAQRCGYPFEFRIKPNQTESGQAKWNWRILWLPASLTDSPTLRLTDSLTHWRDRSLADGVANVVTERVLFGLLGTAWWPTIYANFTAALKAASANTNFITRNL